MAKERSKFQRKLDGFLRNLFFEENGRPKSAAFLYAFLLAILFVLVYLAAFLLLLGPVERAFSHASVTVRNIAEYILPAVVGSGLCLLLMLRPGMRRQVASAYLVMAGLLVLIYIFELFVIDWADAATEYGLFMVLLGLPGLACVLTGGVPALLLYRRSIKQQEAEESRPSRRSWYNT